MNNNYHRNPHELMPDFTASDANMGLEFEAVLTLRTQEEVQELLRLLLEIMHGSVTLFKDLQYDSSLWRVYLQKIVTASKLVGTFLEVCIEEETKRGVTICINSISESIKNIANIFQQLGGGFPGIEEMQAITVEIENFLIQMAEITNFMEDDQIDRIKRCAKLAFHHLILIKESNSNFRLDVKLNDARDVFKQFTDSLLNRLNVMSQSDIKLQVEESYYAVLENTENLLDSTYNYLTYFDTVNQENQIYYIGIFATSIKSIIDIIDFTKKTALCSFQYDEIKRKLEEFEEAIRRGKSSEAAESARFLIEELNKLKGRSSSRNGGDEENYDALNDSCDKLKSMTQALLAAAKSALQNPDDESSKSFLKDALDGVKGQVANVAVMEQETRSNKNDLRMKLLQVAKEMNNNLVDFSKTTAVQ